MGRNIAISGKMCSGKTTLANYLCNKYGYERVSFAAPIKELERIHSDFTSEQWEEVLKPLVDKIFYCQLNHSKKYIRDIILKIFERHLRVEWKNRELLQDIGFTLRSQVDSNIFISLLDLSIKNSDVNFVVDDLRYKNELRYLKSREFEIIRLKISQISQYERYVNLYGKAPDSSASFHESETDLDGVEFENEINASWDLETVKYIIDNEFVAKM